MDSKAPQNKFFLAKKWGARSMDTTPLVVRNGFAKFFLKPFY
jgi:hypothetical protein